MPADREELIARATQEHNKRPDPMSTDLTPAQRAMLAVLPDDAWQTVWTEFRDAYTEFQDRNPGWRAFWTDHHQYALDAAMKALATVLDLPTQNARERATGRKQAADALAAEQNTIAELAIAYVELPEESGQVTGAYHELESAVRHMRAVESRLTGGGEPNAG